MLDRPPQQPKNLVVVENGGPGWWGGCLGVVLLLALLGLSIKYWYVTVPLLVLGAVALIVQSRKTGIPIGNRVRAAFAEVEKQRQARVRSGPLMAEHVVIVKKQRGCTCCGTGCVLMTAVVSLSVVALWDIFGALVAFAAWSALVVIAHVVRFVTGTQHRYGPCMCDACREAAADIR